MAWIELHQQLPTHPKTKRLTRALGKLVPQDIPETVGHLAMFWLWCMDYAIDGSLAKMSAQDIADGAGWTDDPDVFVNAMRQAEFIDTIDGVDYVHDWGDYIGKLLDFRAKEQKRNREKQQRHRERMKQQQEPQTLPELEPYPDDEEIDPEWRRVAVFYEQNIGLLPTGASIEMLLSYYNDFGADVMCEAIRITNIAQANNPKQYLKAVLDRWMENGVKDLETAKAYTKDLERKLADFKQRKSAKSDAGTTDGPPAISGNFY